jgi:hypothetical protein
VIPEPKGLRSRKFGKSVLKLEKVGANYVLERSVKLMGLEAEICGHYASGPRKRLKHTMDLWNSC